LVASVSSIEGLHEVKANLAAATSDVNVWMLSVARGTDQLQRLRLNSLNPAFLVSATKTP
jgi:precorrin-6B C5,15-methyltransferase / cobalt-precorrin-6B C5,C15-methyltransferase